MNPDGGPDVAAHVARAVRAVPARAGGTRVVAVDGPAGSGKSTLAATIRAALDGAPLVRMDDLYPGWDGLADAVPRLLEWVLEPLAAGRAARYRRYDWDAGRYAEWRDVPPAAELVVEGVGSGSRPARPYLSYLVWVQAPHELRMRRGIERDGEAFAPHWLRWARQEATLFAAEQTRRHADVVIDTGGGTPSVVGWGAGQ